MAPFFASVWGTHITFLIPPGKTGELIQKFQNSPNGLGGNPYFLQTSSMSSFIRLAIFGKCFSTKAVTYALTNGEQETGLLRHEFSLLESLHHQKLEQSLQCSGVASDPLPPGNLGLLQKA